MFYSQNPEKKSNDIFCYAFKIIILVDLEPNVFVYLDDIIIATDTLEQHLEVLAKIANRLAKAGLTISPEKSRFCMKRLKYLGYIVFEDGNQLDPEKIEAIVNYPPTEKY